MRMILNLLLAAAVGVSSAALASPAAPANSTGARSLLHTTTPARPAPDLGAAWQL